VLKLGRSELFEASLQTQAQYFREIFQRHPRRVLMIEQIVGKWKGFRQMVNNWLLAMDADPLEDIHNRVRRLEAAFLRLESRTKIRRDGSLDQSRVASREAGRCGRDRGYESDLFIYR
jgi:hypothetical protein